MECAFFAEAYAQVLNFTAAVAVFTWAYLNSGKMPGADKRVHRLPTFAGGFVVLSRSVKQARR